MATKHPLHHLTSILGRAQNLATLAVTGDPIDQADAEEVNGELSEFIEHLEGHGHHMDPEAVDPELASLAVAIRNNLTRTTPNPLELLRAAIAAGLTQQDALDAFAAPADHPAVLAAQEFNEIDEVQVDSRALISPTDDGTWVQAWVWVPAAETTEEA